MIRGAPERPRFTPPRAQAPDIPDGLACDPILMREVAAERRVLRNVGIRAASLEDGDCGGSRDLEAACGVAATSRAEDAGLMQTACLLALLHAQGTGRQVNMGNVRLDGKTVSACMRCFSFPKFTTNPDIFYDEGFRIFGASSAKISEFRCFS